MVAGKAPAVRRGKTPAPPRKPAAKTLLAQTLRAIPAADDPVLAAEIQARLDQLTKPRGSLGRLEELALRYGLATGKSKWPMPRKTLFVFCADHGVATEGVSAYPQDVTHQMVENFLAGGAAVNVLCRQYDIDPVVVDMGVNHTFDSSRGIVDRKVAFGTRNLLREPAMTRPEAVQSVETGVSLAEAAVKLDYGILAVGEMGIANTTAASAIVATLAGVKAAEVAGPGTGLTEPQRLAKARVIQQALDLHAPDPADPLAVLSAVGGFEIGGMCGFLLGAAANRTPVVVDGFIASAAALLALRLAPNLRDYVFFSHRSAEPGHQVLLDLVDARPLLSLEMRLGEGTGAALAIGVLESALRLYREMATFESAGVTARFDRL